MNPGWLRSVLDGVRSRLWPLPLVAVMLAVLLGLVVPRADRAADHTLPGWVSAMLFSGDPDAARTVLDAVSSSLITVTSLTFSLTVVTLQLASSQFSPRLLRTFTSDVFVQATLGLFLATFTFSLTVLRSVRTSSPTQSVFVPRMAVTMSFLLAVASVIGLVVFLAHLARQIRVETMLRDVHDDTAATIDAMVAKATAPPVATSSTIAPDDTVPLFSASSGFLVHIDEPALLACAIEHAVHLRLDRRPGDSVIAGTPIGSVWQDADGSVLDYDAIRHRYAAAVHFGYERTATQDIGFGLRQLTDVATKALSPGINDPTTAVHALSHISALLCTLAGRDLGPKRLCDDSGRVRVTLARPSLAELVNEAVTQPRRYGADDPFVIERLFRLLEELAWHVSAGDESIVREQLRRLDAVVDAADLDEVESRDLRHASARVSEVLTLRRARDE